MVDGAVEGREEPVAPGQDLLRQQGKPRLVVAGEDAAPEVDEDHHRGAAEDPEELRAVASPHGVRTRPVPSGCMRPPSTTTAPLTIT